MPGDPLDKLLDDLASEYTPPASPPSPPAPRSLREEGSPKGAESKGAGSKSGAPDVREGADADDLHPALRALLAPEPAPRAAPAASAPAFVPSTTTAFTHHAPGEPAAPAKPFVPSSAATFVPVAPPPPPVVPPGYAASSVRGLSAPAGPSHVRAPATAVIPAQAGAAEHAVLASIQRDELAALEREQQRLRQEEARLRQEEEVARLRAAQAERQRQEQEARRQQEFEHALHQRATQFLKQLDPYSVEGMWFNEFARKHPDRLTAAVSYLREVKGLG